MTSALHLEHNLDSLQHLTIHLQRNFKLLRELENKADGLRQTIIGVLSDDLLPNISKMDVETRKDMVNTIEGLLEKAKDYEDDKVQLTIQTYELVGKYICRFDSSLTNKATSSRAEQEAAADQETVPIKTRSKRELSVGGRVETETEKGKKTSSRAEQQVAADQEARPIKTRSKCKLCVDERVETETEKGKRKRKRMSYRDMLAMPVYRYQPTYCLCHQKSYGKMIACDNPDCPIEWYHIKCVHVKIIPKGKWYCPKCTQGKDRL